jgi:hypothetical protein
MVDQTDQLSEIGPATQVDDPIEFRMIMSEFAHLNELDLAAKMIHYGLVALRFPPLYCEIVFPTRTNDPKGRHLSGKLTNLRVPCLLLRGEVDITSEYGRLNGETQPVV